MTQKNRLFALSGMASLLSVCLIVTAGCNKGDSGASQSPSSSGAGPGAMSGGVNRGPGGMRGGGAPLAADASGGDIYKAKCGCHGPGGKGGKAPVLTAGAGKSEEDLIKIIHDGKGKMPAFASQLSDDQIKKVATEVKAFN